jgi:hypothetical protein
MVAYLGARSVYELRQVLLARGATIRRDLIHVAASATRHGRGNLPLYLPDAGIASMNG